MATWKCTTNLYYDIMCLKIGIVRNNFTRRISKQTKTLKLITAVITGRITGIIMQNTQLCDMSETETTLASQIQQHTNSTYLH
jgi:hypothetical protein